ncbi:hypothetical protein A2394_02495 [Candidatus Woesebacteria bacterium RIFOXYB1_FULL_42_36]|nr:MAG: hypothetical protein A2208_00140 [Candidatus Woesebacteria bacterium RIFOXYA1_FULL_43_16]OGM81727.1 MAG: hypothetical protein A2394_02495 [Candidatus Woesebacteria bacterium RIFOXYB1_FULL_42_36]
MITPDYIVGMTDGEGCFLVSLRRDNRIDLRFFIVQAIGNRSLLESIQKFFNVGTVYQKADRSGRLPACIFEVTKRDDIYNVIIPFFKEHKPMGIKAISFSVFEEIDRIVKGRQDKRKLTSKELEYVTNLRSGMNKHYGSPGAVKSARRGGNTK